MTNIQNDWHDYLARRAEETKPTENPAETERNRQSAIAQAFADALTTNQKEA